MKIGIIGDGTIGSYVRDRVVEQGHELRALLLLPEFMQVRTAEFPGTVCAASVVDFPDDIDHGVDCAGHAALSRYPAARHRYDDSFDWRANGLGSVPKSGTSRNRWPCETSSYERCN